MKRWLINVSTNWVGMDQEYSAIAKTEQDLEDLAQELAYDNFSSFNCQQYVLEELFPEVEDNEYTEEMEDESAEVEGEYYYYTIEEWDESRDEEEWNWYECVYDSRDIELDKAEEDYNELDNISKT